MPEMRLRRVGRSLVAADAASQELLAAWPVDQAITISVKAPRNDARHRLLFAVIKVAYDNWPEGHAVVPSSPENLRGRLLVDAGHCVSLDVRIANRDDLLGAAAAIGAFLGEHRRGRHAFFDGCRSGMRVSVPFSIAYAKCDELTFGGVLTRVIDEIEAVIGISADDLLRQAEEDSGTSRDRAQRSGGKSEAASTRVAANTLEAA